MAQSRLLFVIAGVFLFASVSYAADIAVTESCTLADAIKSANTDSAVGGCPAGYGEDVIILSADIILDAALPQITSEITIEGGSYTISGAGRHTIFLVADNANLAIKNLEVIEGKAKSCRQPDVEVGITVTRCIDEDYVKIGGAIVNVGGLTLANCDFRNNTATIKSSAGRYKDSGDGGAIANLGTLTVIDSTFSENTAVFGGAIMNWGEIRITNSAFSRNLVTSYQSGGAIMNFGEMNVTNSNFSGNSSELGRGGAIGNVEGSLSIVNSSFSDNSAGSSLGGGAIANWALGELTVDRSTFNENWSKTGGAIKSGGGTELHITDSIFNLNFAEDSGGAVQVSQGKLTTITGSSFTGNSANGSGGAMDVSYGDTVTLVNSSFMKNIAAEVGGAIVNDEYSKLTITDSMFGDNSASRGGAIGNWGELAVNNSSFAENLSASNGGAISNYKGTVTVTNSSFGGNSAEEGRGGGIFADAGIVTLTHVSIAYNTASVSGGIYVAGEDFEPLLVLNNSIIASNKGGDCYSGISDANRINLIEDGSCFTAFSGDPTLGGLVVPEDGSAAYFPLLEGSPAIDVASDEFCGETDQIGTERPQGAGCDIGAIEFVVADN